MLSNINYTAGYKGKIMLAVNGIYEQGKLQLQEDVPFTKPVKVIVTFLEEVQPKKLDLNQFSFAESQALLKDVKGSFSDAVIEERGNIK